MSGSTTSVACGRCKRLLDERSDIAPDDRPPCPVCGSLQRQFGVSLTAVVAVGSGGAVAGGFAPSARVEVASVPEGARPEAKEIAGTYEATCRWFKLGEMWMLQVVDVKGEVVEGGIGDSPEDALLEVYERLIPPATTA